MQQNTERKMYQGNWTCSGCGNAITQLPFEPRGAANNLLCSNCFQNTPRVQKNGPAKKWHQGNWTCSGCGGSITELPFEPDPARANELLCKECHLNKVKQRDDYQQAA